MEELSGVFIRHQRLIHKGKVLVKGASMADTNLKDGSKVMLMASASTATQVGLLFVTTFTVKAHWCPDKSLKISCRGK